MDLLSLIAMTSAQPPSALVHGLKHGLRLVEGVIGQHLRRSGDYEPNKRRSLVGGHRPLPKGAILACLQKGPVPLPFRVRRLLAHPDHIPRSGSGAHTNAICPTSQNAKAAGRTEDSFQKRGRQLKLYPPGWLPRMSRLRLKAAAHGSTMFSTPGALAHSLSAIRPAGAVSTRAPSGAVATFKDKASAAARANASS